MHAHMNDAKVTSIRDTKGSLAFSLYYEITRLENIQS